MEALSICSVKGEFLSIPHLESDQSSSYISRERRKKQWGCGYAFSTYVSFGSTNSRELSNSHGISVCRRSRNLSSQCWFVADYSKPNSLSNCKHSKIFFGASVALVGALEQETIGNVVAQGETDLECKLSENSEDIEVGYATEDVVNDNGSVDKKDKEKVVTKEEDSDGNELGKENSGKVDVRALAQSLWSAKSVDDVEEVLKEKGELPLPVYSSVIRGFGIDKRVDAAIALVEWLRWKRVKSGSSIGPNLFIYNSLLGALKQSEKYGEVDKVMEDMAQQGIIPNVVTYNALMSIYIEQGQPEKALNVLAEIQKVGLFPSPVTYSTALLAYRRMEDGEGALGFFCETREKYRRGEIGKHMDHDWENEFVKLENFTIRICYQVMRRWLVKGDHLTANVLKLLTDMDKAGFKPSRAEYERLVWACTLESHYTVGKELYGRIRERDTEISLSVCNHVIWLMGKAKKWWAALEVYEDMLDKGPKPNNLSYELIVSHFNILLTAARRRGIWRWGVRLLNKMQDKGLNPGSREWNAVLVACSKASETSAAVQIFRRMIEQGEKPTVLSYGALLSALEKGKLYDEALRVWEHMCKVGVKPNLYAYTTLVSIYIGQGQSQEVDSVISEMVSSGIEPTVVTFNAIISGCARNRMGSAAFEWFHRMKAQNISPNEITYQMLIEALAKDAKPRLAYEMYLRARNEGLKLPSRAYDAVVQSSHYYMASIDLSALGARPPDKKKSLNTRKDLSEFCNLAGVPRRSRPFDKEEIYSSQSEEKQ